MATINKVIEQVDGMKLNTFDTEAKFNWLADLDGQISLLVMEKDEPIKYEYPRDMDTPLLVGAPFEGIYAAYLEAQIDLHNREYDDYNNIILVYAALFEEYKKWYTRNHMPKSAGNVKNHF